jgi:Rrf2 family transcriptional regulator, cysteine metabolism repressor
MLDIAVLRRYGEPVFDASSDLRTLKTQIRRNAMKLSTRGRYGTRLMLELAKHYGKGPVSMTEISKKQDIPVKYLEQIIIPLKKANLVLSIRGPKGGHMLSRPPDQINVWEVLLLLESKLTFVDCLTNESACENAGNCVVRPLWARAYEAVMNLFQETTLKDLLVSTHHP